MRFQTAQQAFEYYYQEIFYNGEFLDNTKFIQNIGFYIEDPLNNQINTPWRKWKPDYAQYEWEWYLSGNRSVSEIKKRAKIWDKMHNGNDIVNSNYGYQWNRNNQLDYIIKELTEKPTSRRAVLTIYDGKEHGIHQYDTPCTLTIMFDLFDNKLNMSVTMRSNDLWFGFCNDQYCFSKLQELVAIRLNKPIGLYYHFAHNLHLYDIHFKNDKRI